MSVFESEQVAPAVPGSPSHPLPSLGLPMNGQIRAQVANELDAIPRGTLAQNLFRAAYEQARLNALGARPQIGPTPAEAQQVALSAVREQFPGFIPVLK